MLTRFLKHLPVTKRSIDDIGDIDWAVIEISPTCKILIYQDCVKEFTEIIRNKFSKSVLYNSKDRLLSEVIREAHVLAGWRFPDELLQKAKNLKWIQLISAGLSVTEKGYSIPDYISNDVIVTNTKGVYSDVVADYVIWAMLTMKRKFYKFLQEQPLKRWGQHNGDDLSQKTVGILGLGQIGLAVAERAKALGMNVIGIKKNFVREALSFVAQVYPIGKLYQVLSTSDIVVLCLPLTVETEGFLGIEEFRSMKRDAIFIDVSRGGIVKEKDLIKALKDKLIAGAVLDVFQIEPLPPDNELWDLDNVVITPHISSLTKNYSMKVGQFLCANIQQFIAGKSLANVIDRAKGY